MSDLIEVFVVDDHPVVLEGIRIVLGDSADMRLVGSATTPAQAAIDIPLLSPDVVLLDVRLGREDPIALVRTITATIPSAAVLLFTADPAHPSIPAALAAGARAVVSKDVGSAALSAAIRAAFHRARVIGVDVASDPPNLASIALTPRELEVLRHVALGQTNPEIATELGLTTSTVKTYWQTAMQKLDVRTRTEAVRTAHRLGLLDYFL